jgi:hypothetical protein
VLLEVYVYFGRVAALFCTKCAYFGRIVAPPRVKRFFSSVNSRPTHRYRRALTSAESWPCSASSGFLFGQLETDASLQACAYFGRIVALLRVKRFSLRSTRDRRIAPGVRLLRPNRGPAPRQAVFSSVTTISDRLGVRAPKAIRAKAVTYRAEGHFED